MTPLYFYTPVFETALDEGGDPITTPARQPGQDGEAGIEPLSALPSGMNVLEYDDGLSRCVVKVPYGTSRCEGWIPKYPEQVLEDYPGLNGVV